MAQPNELAGTAADPLAALTAALMLLLPNQPATTLQTNIFEWTMSDQHDEFKIFESPQRASSIFRQYQMNLMTKVPAWSIY